MTGTAREPDRLLVDIAEYALSTDPASPEALETAGWCLADTLGCGLESLGYPACTRLLGPVVPGTVVPGGVPVPGTSYVLDPIKAAFDIGAMVRWLDFNDTWLAAEWGHPTDNLGGLLATADWVSRQALARGEAPLLVGDLLAALVKTHEIQGVLALANSFNRVGLDHVVLVKVASTALCTALLGGTHEQVVNALSQAWVDGQSLRTYRHFPNAGSRKSWAAGDATSRAVRFAMISVAGEMGIPTVLTARTWGLYDVLFGGKPLVLERPFGSYVMENVLFKIRYPAEFHAQTAVECALALHGEVAGRLDEVERVVIRTHESAIRIIDKGGPLANPADRDHCMQYMVAVPLIHGRLTAADYEDDVAADPRIDALREKIECVEDPDLSQAYIDPERRAIGNAVQVFFADGSATREIAVDYPVGHRRRRAEGIPLLEEKFRRNLARVFAPERQRAIADLMLDRERLAATAVPALMDLLAA